VRQSYVPVDFVVLETGGDVRAPIILGRPFLSTVKAIIYADSAKICFIIKDNKEKFSFKNHILQSPSHPQKACLPEETIITKKKKNQRRRKNKTRQPQEETINMINTLQSEYDHLLVSSYLTKKDDLGIPTIECIIGQRIFHKTFYDIRSGVNIMCKVMYEYLFGDEPLFPIYMQLHMADQSIRFPEGIAKDVMIRIHDQFAPADFMVLDIGEEEYNKPIILERPFLNTTNAIIYVRSGQVHFQFPRENVRCYFNSYTTYEQTKKTHSRRKRRSSQRRKNQPPKNRWKEDEELEEPVKDEPTPPKSCPQTKQVWKEKVTSSEPPSHEVQPSRSPSPRPADAPKE
jgi:hypothetical protein